MRIHHVQRNGWADDLQKPPGKERSKAPPGTAMVRPYWPQPSSWRCALSAPTIHFPPSPFLACPVFCVTTTGAINLWQDRLNLSLTTPPSPQLTTETLNHSPADHNGRESKLERAQGGRLESMRN